MNNTQRQSLNFLGQAFQRPLILISGLMAIGMILLGLFYRLQGNAYIEGLNFIDAFTPVMIGVLILRGLFSLQNDSDLQAVSLSLIGALSFIFTYEVIYKISFYIPPKVISGEELREFTIQVGIGLTVLAGFAFGKYRLSKASLICIGIFVAAWIFWLLAGFPQVENMKNYYPATLHVPFTWNMLYLLNRGTKVITFFAYFFLYRD